MSNPIHRGRITRMCAASALTLAVAFAAVPVAAQAAAVDLGTATPFVVLGGQTVTNTGPSVLTGDLGVSPGSAITGFPPGVVIGAIHASDAVAMQAQNDVTTAYNAAAGEPATVNLTGQDLGGMTLSPGTYTFSTSAQLTGALTLDGQGDPNARFVFQVGSTLTTASASSVSLINSASACNVAWQIGSSATLGTGSSFQGDILALTSITLTTGATLTGRALARNGAVTLDTNVIDRSTCPTSTPPPPAPTPDTTSGGGANPAAPGGGGSTAHILDRAITTRNGRARIRRTPAEAGTPSSVCTAGFNARVRGAMIERVVFTMDGRRVGSRVRSPFTVSVRSAPAGRHIITARVTFTDATRARTLTMPYRACGIAKALLKPRSGPSRFTG
jgi:hypothetical protein